jgi:Putative zinc-finger
VLNVAPHPSDEEIVQCIDRELPDDRAQAIRAHLSICPKCNERRASIEAESKSLNEFYGSESTDLNATMSASRTKLQEKLAERAGNHPALRVAEPGFHAHFPISAVAALFVVGLVFYCGETIWKLGTASRDFARQIVTPNHSLTPGAVRSVSLNEICSSQDSDLDPKVSSTTETAVLREYGLTSDPANVRNYQIDYLVNPQLGGTNDIRNLWPQPYSNSAWNAHDKDVLEQHLHLMVCNRTVDLATAQRDIEVDWVAAYKKYVEGGAHPVSHHG